MAMGDLTRLVNFGGARASTAPLSSWRGSHTGRLVAAIYRQRDGAQTPPLNLSPYLTGVQTAKTVDGNPGTFSATLKPDAGATSEAADHVDWHAEIENGDWFRVLYDDGRSTWDVMVGTVDTVSARLQSVQGADDPTWTITGRDLTKCLVESQTLNLPHIGLTTTLGIGSLLSALNFLSRINARTPGQVTRALFNYFMGADPRPDRGTFFRVPLNFPATFTAGAAPPLGRRQLSDVVDVDGYVVDDLPGVTAAFGSLTSIPAQGSQVWDTIRSYANTTLNECFIDLRPRPTVTTRSPLAYAVPKSGTGAGGVVPALIVRERPFNTVPGTAPHRVTAAQNSPFQQLPTTTIDTRDVVSLNLSAGQERFNYFLVDAGGANLQQAVTFALGSQFGGGPVGPKGMFDGVPAIDLESVQRHGLRRMETTSIYVNAVGDQIDVYRLWSRILRDWHMLAHTYLSGTLTLAFGAPGIRAGERLILRGFGDHHGHKPPVQFYVEGVTHQMRVTAQGVPVCSTTLTVTRGTRNPDEIQTYAASFAAGSGSAIAAPGQSALANNQDAQAQAQANAAAASAGGADQGFGPAPAPEDVTGTGPDGAPVAVPPVVE